jgi:hypothetical protein
MENRVAGYQSETEQERLSRLVRYFESAEQATFDSRALAEKARDYYDGEQWSEAEIAALKKRKQPVTTINRIKPKVDFLLGMETQRRSLPKAHPRTPKHEDDAAAAGDALRYVIEDQQFEVTSSKGFENLCIEGLAGVDVSVVNVKGEMQIRILPIEWDRIFFDPHSRKRDFSDAKYKGQVIWQDYEDAVAEYPDKADVLASTISTESTLSETHGDVPRIRWADPKRKRVRIVEIWHQEGGKWYHCIYTKGGTLHEEESPYIGENGESVDGFVFGSAYVDRDGNRYGAVKNWIDIQDEINKRRSKALHLLSVRQVKYEKGAVDDVNKMRQELAKPDGAIEVTPGMMFEALDTGDMATAQFNLLQEAKSEIDAVGVNAALSGTEQRQMSGRALIARQESGLSELGPLFDAYKQWKLNVYRAVWDRIKQFWTEERWIRVTDDEKNVRFVGLNKPTTLGQQLIEEAKAQGIEITQDMQMQAERDPSMQQQAGIENNVTELDVDIVLDDVPASPSVQAEQFETLAGLAKAGLQIPPQAIIKASALRNKDEILKEMGVGGPSAESQAMQQQMLALTSQMQEMAQALKDKSAEQAVKSREVGVKEYAAETDRMTALAPAMTPEMVQAMIVQTLKDVLGPMQAPMLMQPPMQPQMGMPQQ